MATTLPTTMRALTYTSFGGPEALNLELKFPVPTLLEDALLIRVHAASINPIDWKLLKGMFPSWLPPFPVISGLDVSGEVIAIGSQVRRFKVGDEVFSKSSSHGAFAEYIALKEDIVALKPKNASFAESASIPLVGLTSYQSLLACNLQKDQTILITGGSSGTGAFAIQWAKNVIGAKVITTASTNNIPFAQSFGPDQIIDYTKQKWWEVLQGAKLDAIYDCVGADNANLHAPQVLKETGFFVTIAGASEVAGNFQHTFVLTKSSGDHLGVIREAYEAKKVRATVEKVYAFEDYASLFRHSLSGRVLGKIVLQIINNQQEQKQQPQKSQ
jgi:NADPH:quinone reductase-like Zn-dependent oxidoreductase